MKRASLRQIGGIRHAACNWLQTGGIFAKAGEGREKAKRIRMSIIDKDIPFTAELDDLASINHRNMIAGLGNNPKIMGDQDHGYAILHL